MAVIHLGATPSPVSDPTIVSGKELRIRGLCKSYPHRGRRQFVLAGFDLTVRPGEFVVLLGPSGCGKSTLLRIITGLDAPDPEAGTQLLLDAQPITGPGPDRGIVFQSYSSFPWLTAKQNVMFGLQFCVRDRKERERRALKYLELVGLLDYADYYPKALSGGQQQRVAIARTLATGPQLLLMDEPYAALDAQSREVQQTELLRIWRQTRPTILFVTHDISEAAFLAQRVLVLSTRPASIVEEVDTESALERRLAQRLHAASSSGGDADGLVPCAADGTRLSIHQRDHWIRTQPEYYELIARLKEALPRPLQE